MRLIDADALVVEIARIGDLRKLSTATVGKAIHAVPEVDAVQVVRCRDCKYGEPETNMFGDDMVMCQNKQNPIGYEDLLMSPEFYCEDGERRD